MDEINLQQREEKIYYKLLFVAVLGLIGPFVWWGIMIVMNSHPYYLEYPENTILDIYIVAYIFYFLPLISGFIVLVFMSILRKKKGWEEKDGHRIVMVFGLLDWIIGVVMMSLFIWIYFSGWI
jgi:hypothetical protein